MPQSGNVTPVRYDLIQYARVTQVISNTVFISDDLAGFLSDTFIGYSVWVLTKTDGTITAPRGEDPKLISIFEGNGTGQVTHAAFTANLAVGDEVLILHPSVANATTMAALIGTIITSLVNLPDGVYLDTISGFAGTAWPIGSPGRPALTLADALTIAAARNLSKLYLVGDGAHTLTLTNGFSMRIEGNPEYAITIPALATVLIESDLVCGQLTNNGSIQVDGDLTTNIMENLAAGGIYIDGNTKATAITNSAGGDITIIGTLDCTGGFDNTGGDDIGITGDTFIGGTLTLSGASDLTIYGNTHVSAINCGTTGVVAFHGSAQINGAFTNTTTATIVVDGDFEAGTNLDLTGSTSFTVRLNVQIGGTLTNTTGSVAINGNTWIGGDVSLNGVCTVTFNGNCSVEDDVTVVTTDIVVIGQFSCDVFDLSGSGASLNVKGGIRTNGGLTIGAGITTIYGDVSVGGNFTHSGSGVTLVGNLEVFGNINNSGGNLSVSGDIKGGGNITTSTVTVTASGSVQIRGYVMLTDIGDFQVFGNLKCASITGSANACDVDVRGNTIASEINTAGSTTDWRFWGDVLVELDVAISGTGGITIEGNLEIANDLALSNTGDLTVNGNLRCDAISMTNSGAQLNIYGDIRCTSFTATAGSKVLADNFFCSGIADLTAVATINISGNFYASNLYRTTGTANFWGDVDVGGDFNMTGTGNTTVYGCVYAANSITLSNTGDLSVRGDLKTSGTITIGNTGAVLTVTGDITCNAFTSTANGGISCYNFFCAGAADFTSAESPVIAIKGNLNATGQITNTTGALTVSGNTYCGATFVLSGTCTVNLNGDIEAAGGFQKTSTGTCNIRGNVYCGNQFIHNAAATINIYGNMFCTNSGISVPGGGTLNVAGDVYCSSFSEVNSNTFNCNNLFVTSTVDFSGTTTINVYGDYFSGSTLTNTTGTLTITGDCKIGGNFSTTTGDVVVLGNCEVAGTTTASGASGSLTISGNAHLVGAVGATDAAASITIYGIAEIYGAITATGTVTYKGKHPEVAVSFNATDVAAEFFHLAAATGTQYDVSKVRIKCADPGAQTVTVTLEEYVNGALTAVDTFAITTANYTNYFSLMDMFGVDHLSGDELRISAVASDAGPYAVTGSYVYSNH